MREREPEDATPYEPRRRSETFDLPLPPGPRMPTEPIDPRPFIDGIAIGPKVKAEHALKALRHQARSVGLSIADDGTHFWPILKRERYPLSGAKVHVETGDKHVTATRVATMGVFALAAKKVTDVRLHFEGPKFELVVKVPAAGRGHAHEFAAAFNTYAMNH